MNECAICFHNMDEIKGKLTQCDFCKKCIHTKCYKLWKNKNITEHSNKCVYCQRYGGLYRINLSPWDSFILCCLG